MAETPSTQIFFGRATFAAFGLAIIFLLLLPINAKPERWPFPDFLMIATFVWVTRRPDFAPVLIIALLFLLADLLFQRPPGLMAALIVIASEMLRARSRDLRDFPIWLEWATVAGAVLSVVVVNRIALGITMSDQAPLGPTLVQMIITIAIYPVMILVARVCFGVARPALGQVNTYGRKI